MLPCTIPVWRQAEESDCFSSSADEKCNVHTIDSSKLAPPQLATSHITKTTNVLTANMKPSRSTHKLTKKILDYRSVWMIEWRHILTCAKTPSGTCHVNYVPRMRDVLVVCACVICTHALPLAHLMEVCPSTNNDYLGIARVAQICCQLPLSWPVPAHVEEDLDNDKYYDDSVKERRVRRGWGGQRHVTVWKLHLEGWWGHMLYSHVPVQLHFSGMSISGWRMS